MSYVMNDSNTKEDATQHSSVMGGFLIVVAALAFWGIVYFVSHSDFFFPHRSLKDSGHSWMIKLPEKLSQLGALPIG